VLLLWIIVCVINQLFVWLVEVCVVEVYSGTVSELYDASINTVKSMKLPVVDHFILSKHGSAEMYKAGHFLVFIEKKPKKPQKNKLETTASLLHMARLSC
jgi:hypothetical protein